ncbi:MAG TPA: hypothetical protein VM262_11750 [Acidimicrobiales bacterium]|nr:hypothetical protein [Acidimicrobiales bacterium]
MAIEVETKDCTALSDTEVEEMADICADGPARYDIGLLSKQREEWVLVTRARNNGVLQGFSFSTLERIGGTPCVLIGLASVKRTAKRSEVLKALMLDELRRAVMAFPDEDVLVGTQVVDPSGYEAFACSLKLQDITPRPGYKTTGEDRAWGRRLAKRFGVDDGYDDRSFRTKGQGSPPCVLDHETLKPEKLIDGLAELFKGLDLGRGDSLVAFGWAMEEDLRTLA